MMDVMMVVLMDVLVDVMMIDYADFGSEDGWMW